MKSASISYAKAHLSDLVRRARSGREVLITDRGIPVARLVPVELGSLSSGAVALIADGIARPPRAGAAVAWSGLVKPPSPPDGVSLLDAVLAEREEGR